MLFIIFNLGFIFFLIKLGLFFEERVGHFHFLSFSQQGGNWFIFFFIAFPLFLIGMFLWGFAEISADYFGFNVQYGFFLRLFQVIELVFGLYVVIRGLALILPLGILLYIGMYVVHFLKWLF